MTNILKRISIILFIIFISYTLTFVSNATDANKPIEEDIDADVNVLMDSILDSVPLNEITSENDLNYNSSGKNFFSASPNNIELSDDIIGDAFILSGGTVTIDCNILGNVFICARNVIITNNTHIYASLFNVSEDVSIQGLIDGNSYITCQNFDLKSTTTLGLDLFLVSQNCNIDGTILRNVSMAGKNIKVSETSKVGGDFNYSSNEQISIPENVVEGNVNYSASNSDVNIKEKNEIIDFIYDCISLFVFSVVLYFIYKWINCKIITEHTEFTKNIGKYILYGLLGLFITPIISFILLTSNLTFKLSLVLLALYFIFILIASSNIIVILSNLCAEKYKETIKINDTLRLIVFIAIFTVLYQVIKLLPVLGSIFTFFVVLIGIGNIIKTIIPKKKDVTTE